MIARAGVFTIQPGKMAEAVDRFRALLEAEQQEAGFTSALLLTDPNTEQGIVAIIFETTDDLRAADADPNVLAPNAKVVELLADIGLKGDFEVSLFV